MISPPKALLFDVFGTWVDRRSSILAEGEALARRLAYRVWTGRRRPTPDGRDTSRKLDTVRSGARPWTRLDVLHREAVDGVLADFALEAVPEEDRADFNLLWHQLAPWPDTVEGLQGLKQRFIIAPSSNGHIALLLRTCPSAPACPGTQSSAPRSRAPTSRCPRRTHREMHQ